MSIFITRNPSVTSDILCNEWNTTPPKKRATEFQSILAEVKQFLNSNNPKLTEGLTIEELPDYASLITSLRLRFSSATDAIARHGLESTKVIKAMADLQAWRELIATFISMSENR